MGDLDRLVPSGAIERWIYHLRRQRSRALDAIWLVEAGQTIHDGRNGIPTSDATARYLAEQQAIVAEVGELLEIYDSVNTRMVVASDE